MRASRVVHCCCLSSCFFYHLFLTVPSITLARLCGACSNAAACLPLSSWTTTSFAWIWTKLPATKTLLCSTCGEWNYADETPIFEMKSKRGRERGGLGVGALRSGCACALQRRNIFLKSVGTPWVPVGTGHGRPWGGLLCPRSPR